MATLENIRKRGKLLAIIIGLSLLAFIVGDLFTSGSSIFGSQKTKIATVNGNDIDIQDFEVFTKQTEDYVKALNGQDNIDEQTVWQIRASAWDMLIREKLLDKVFQKHSFYLSPEEIKDITIGSNPHSLVQQTFVNPQTGVFDKNFLIQILQNLQENKMPNDPSQRQQYERIRGLWMYIENYIKFDQALQKYVTLLSKALYTNKLEVEFDNAERKKVVNIEIVFKQIFDIKDESISYTEKDLKDYYNKHKNLFYSYDDKISINYVEFVVKPLKDDTLAAQTSAKNIYSEIEKSADAENIFVEGTKSVKFYTQNELKQFQLDSIKMEIGKTFGPTLLYGSYHIFKVLSIQERPDSVSARHILISPQNPKVGTMERANQIADSLLEVLKKGGDFAQIVKQYSDDPGSVDKGGLYENFTDGQMVTEFNEYCFTKKIGELGKVQTQYGVHIIDVTARKNVSLKPKMLDVKVDIYPSEKTYNEFYALAAKMRGEMTTIETFDTIAQKYKVNVKSAFDLNKGSNSMPGLQSAREIIRWAFNTEKPNEVSQVFQMSDRYIVAVIVNKKEFGYVPFENVKKEIENSVKFEKKVEKLYNESFANVQINDLDALAQKLNVQKMSIPNVSFNAFQIANVGYEPAVLAAIYNANEPKVIGPIKGKNGVYVVKITEITNPQAPTTEEFNQQKDRLNSALRNRASFQAINALKQCAKITDRRNIFY